MKLGVWGCNSTIITLLIILLFLLPFVMPARRIDQRYETSSPAQVDGGREVAGGRAEAGGRLSENGGDDKGMKSDKQAGDEMTAVQERGDEYYHKRAALQMAAAAGSRLPDCSHACGSCHPCKLVLVSYVCSTTQEAETCPMAYKCMCDNKSYPVP
ncbi:unnamed protein product [Cuscuta epithymum]|uniref:Epidermal patterning factor-like protein n=1 Tax=Cuscuta epithymum TaxID=186058 RepID=A0AAV0EBR6_9ASTE|nr:unnamed protein product [Cuscuta epithymum]